VLEGLGEHVPEPLAALFLAGGGAQLVRPVGPGQALVFLLRRLVEDLDLGDGPGAVAVGGADAVGAGVAAADDDDVLAVGADEVFVGDIDALHALGVGAQEVHGEVDAVVAAPGHVEVAGLLRAAGEHDGVVVVA
jgi:hypothetical protein